MATCNNSCAALTCATTISDNDYNPHMVYTTTTTNTTLPSSSSDDGEHEICASGTTTTTTTMMMMPRDDINTSSSSSPMEKETLRKGVKDVDTLGNVSMLVLKEESSLPQDRLTEHNREGESPYSKKDHVTDDNGDDLQLNASMTETSYVSQISQTAQPHNGEKELSQISQTEEPHNGEKALPCEKDCMATRPEQRESILLGRLPKLKREKSYSETLERKKKKVKFSTSDSESDVIVDTRVFDPQVVSEVSLPQPDTTGAIVEEGTISSTLKKLLRKRSKKRKANIETQTDDKDDEKKFSAKIRRGGGETKEGDTEGSSVGSDHQPTYCTSLGNSMAGEVCSESVTATDTIVSESARVPDSSISLPPSVVPVSDSPMGTANIDVSSEVALPRVLCPATSECQDVVAECHESDECLCILENLHEFEVPDSCCENDNAYNEEYLQLNNWCEVPEGKDESDKTRVPSLVEAVVSRSREVSPQPDPENDSITTSMSTVKREGTFTLDDSPPAKITKSVTHAENDAKDSTVPSRDSVMEPLLFFIPMDKPEAVVASEATSNVPEAKKNNRVATSKTKPTPRPNRLNLSLKIPPSKVSQEKTSPVAALKNNAKKTFATVLRSAMKQQQEVTEKTTSTRRPLRAMSSVTKQERTVRTNNTVQHQQPRKSVTWERQQPTATTTTTKTQPKEQHGYQRRCRESYLAPSRTPTERTSVWGGVSMAAFRREGTYTKKYDSERDRLQAECNRLSVERDRLQSELQEARTRQEEEGKARRAQKRSHELNLRQLRENEARRTEVMLADVRNRLEDEKRECLNQLRDSLVRTHEADLQRAERERDETHRRHLQEAKTTQEKLRAEIRRENSRSDHSPAPCCHHCTDRDLDRMNRDLSTLRDHKKRLEEAVMTLQESERQRVGELRRLHEQHETTITKIHRTNKSDAAKMLDELRSRERAIGQLERQVTSQATKLRLQEEKLQQRDGSNDRSEDIVARRTTTRGGGGGGSGAGSGSNGGGGGKKQKDTGGKDGKSRDKESCGSQNNNNNNSTNTTKSDTPTTQTPNGQPMNVDPAPSSPPPQPQSQPLQHPSTSVQVEEEKEKKVPLPIDLGIPQPDPNLTSDMTPLKTDQTAPPPQLSPPCPTPVPQVQPPPPTAQSQSSDPLESEPPKDEVPMEAPQPSTPQLTEPQPPLEEPMEAPQPSTPQLTEPQPPKEPMEISKPTVDHHITEPQQQQPPPPSLEPSTHHQQLTEQQPHLLESHTISSALTEEVEALKVKVEQQRRQMEQQLDQMEQEKSQFEMRSLEMLREIEEQREIFQTERLELEERVREVEMEVEEKDHQVEEQREVVDAQRQVLEEQKQVMEEQQIRIMELAEEVMEHEDHLAPPHLPHPLPNTWHQRRESCVKVSELPTVPELNSSDEESSTTTTTPTDPNTPTTITTFPDLHHYHTPTTTTTTTFPDYHHHHPTTLLTPTTPGNSEPPMWPQVPMVEMSQQYAQLSREHQELQKGYQLLVSAASSPTTTTTTTHTHKHTDAPAAWWTNGRLGELETEVSQLRAELQESRDHADLLEFRCLELTEGAADKGSELVSEVETRDQSTSTEAEETPSEDLSLPLSIDSGLDLSSDYKKARVSEGRVWLAQLSCAAGNPDCPAALHLSSLLDWVAALPALPHHAPSTPVSPTLATPSRDRMGVEEIGCSMGRDLMVLAARLQESLADPPTQETVLLDTISKLRVLERSLSGLQERVASLTEENRELHETVANLSEAQETRTEASGTESELVHRKTPSIHSDLSDAELSDSPEHIQSRGGKLGSALDATTSFQESGIFDTSCDLVHSTTQTDLRDLDLRKSEYDLHESECDLKQAEGNLQSAVARLAAIRSAVQDRDLRHLRIQDLQESEEYLKAALDGSQISLTKVEYDTLVDTERRLRQEMENLKCEKQELEHQCSSLRHQAATQKGTDAEEALKGEIRVLRQRLAMTERAHREIFEEKCELEEEENDSRLMVQRLESQMEAAREMENLLSASLSQEQEISRELHRRVRDLQILEKEYRARLERMISLRVKAEEKAISLVKDKDTLTQQLMFAMYGLLLVDNWRLTVPQHALVPYIGKKLKVIDGCDITIINKNHQNIMEYDESVTDTYTKEIEPQIMMEFESCEKNGSECVCVLVSCDASVQTCLNDSAECDSPVRGNIKEKRDQATMTPKCVSLSEREEYYLEQIEHLQKEKMNLRKGHDNERRDSLQHHRDLEGELLEVRSQLEEAEHDKGRLLFRLEEIQDEKETIKRNLLQRIEEIKGDMGRYNDIFELEKKSLQKSHDSQLHKAEKERSRLDERVRQLEFQISTFKQELEIVGVAVANDLVEMDAEMESVLSQSTKSTIKHGASDGELVNKIRELVKSETSLRQRIYDLEKKECAYHETIREADKIMSSHVTSYKQRIEDLESAAGQQDSKIKQLEASEERLRAALRSSSRTSDGERISDLLDRLIQTENSELKLKERVWNLEKNEKELQIKLMEGEKANQSLRGELRDQEELVHRLMSLETENTALSAELSQAQDSARKVSELQQNESYLRGRVEELEVTENMLRETLHQADLILSQRERKFRDQVSSLQEELQSCRSQLEAGTLREHCAKEAESAFKKQLEDLKTRLAEAEKELLESSSETISHETQHRSEVTKLRNQLKLCNSQLLELDRLNCELRERVEEAEREGQRYASELEELSRRHEQDLLAFNLQVCSRDSHVEDLENQVEQLSQSRAAGELDALAATPLPALHAALRALTTAVKSCDSCSATQSATLVDVSGQLGTLTELLEGQCNSLDTTTSDAEEDVSETAENLATGATTTHPSYPAREGVQDASSGDDDNDSSNSADNLNTNALRRRSKRRLNKGMERRQAKVVAASSTILEELEEKVKEMEEVLGVKEEELRQKEEQLRLRSELVGVKEQELRLADAEASELNSKLQTHDAALIEKSKEVEELNSALASLRQQLVITLEEAERTRLSIHANYQKNFEALKRKAEQITEQVEWLSRRGQLKDSIISTLAMQIRAILRSGNMGVIVNQIRSLSKADKANRQQLTDANNTPAVPDFDVESVCSLLSQPGEMASLPQSATLEPPSHMILQSSTSLAPSTTKPGHVSPLASRVCSLVHHKKSRIPRFLTPPTTPSPIPNPKPTTLAFKPRPASLKLIKPPVQTIKLIPPKTDGTSTPTHQPKRVEPAPQSVQTKPAPVVRQDAKPAPSKATSNLMPVMSSSTPAKATGRKDTTRPEVPTRVLTDARKVKRMITGVAPLDAAVNCSAAPEWKEGSPAPQANSTCVPRPQNLHITRRVGVDGVVIAWDPLEHDCVAGFQVLLGGRVVQHVRSPHRTKALVTSLPLAGSITVGLVAVASDGRCSTPALVTQDRSRNYPGRTVAQKPLRRAVPTAL